MWPPLGVRRRRGRRHRRRVALALALFFFVVVPSVGSLCPADAVPFSSPDDRAAALLPEWYMPAPSLRRSTPRTIVLAGVAVALFVINVGGVCVTYGIPDPVWK